MATKHLSGKQSPALIAAHEVAFYGIIEDFMPEMFQTCDTISFPDDDASNYLQNPFLGRGLPVATLKTGSLGEGEARFKAIPVEVSDTGSIIMNANKNDGSREYLVARHDPERGLQFDAINFESTGRLSAGGYLPEVIKVTGTRTLDQAEHIELLKSGAISETVQNMAGAEKKHREKLAELRHQSKLRGLQQQLDSARKVP